VPKTYKIVFARNAGKYFSSQHKDQQKRLAKAILTLPNGDTKKLKGYKGLYRLRVGDYRIIYTIKPDESLIAVLKIGNRRDVYKS